MSSDLPRRLALFGGTFDPIHRGHLELATRAREALALDEVRFLPCHTSPHKIGVASAPPDDRLEMVRLAIRGLPWATVDDFDLRTAPPAIRACSPSADSAASSFCSRRSFSQVALSPSVTLFVTRRAFRRECG